MSKVAKLACRVGENGARALTERAMEQMVLGVSTRRYARSLEPLPEAVTVRGVSKSAVSERFVYGTEPNWPS